MSLINNNDDVFLPATRVIELHSGVRYRPIRSWHVGTFAGEGHAIMRGDRSGCVDVVNGRKMTSCPYTAIHRFYWHASDPKRIVSAFLSYPNGMGSCDVYFWEAMLDDADRFVGDNAEAEMEAAVVAHLVKGIPS